jgi:triosephosphate isomerase
VRKRLIAGNWKMFKIQSEAIEFTNQLSSILTERATAISLQSAGTPEAVICAPATLLSGLSMLAAKGVGIGAQNMHEAAEGAFTGEVSAGMLKDVGCQYVILGHSERRAYFNETDSAVANKTRTALQSGIAPIVCVGESLEVREEGRTDQCVSEQLQPVLQALKAYEPEADGALEVSKTVIAYEPIWAIGTGRSSSAKDAQQVIGAIRQLMVTTLGETVANQIRILYGGSVKPDNIAAYLSEADIDGALVGGASLQADSYAELLARSVS